jgi:hypothetical protein
MIIKELSGAHGALQGQLLLTKNANQSLAIRVRPKPAGGQAAFSNQQGAAGEAGLAMTRWAR